MKKILILALVTLLALPSWAQGKKMSALFSYATFYLPSDNKPYVETYLSFDAWTMNFVRQADGQFQATAEVDIAILSGDSAIFRKSYDLQSPAIANAEATNFNFLDLQRFSVPNGIYDMIVKVKDKSASTEPFSIREKLVVYYGEGKPAFSSLQMMSSATKTSATSMFSRGGYDMIPYIDDFVPESISQLNVYFELYNLDKELGPKAFSTFAYVEQQETGRRAGHAERFTRHPQAKSLNPIYTTLDITQLPSGNYNLVVEVLNKAGEKLLYKKVPFQRSNPNINIYDSVSNFASTFVAHLTDESDLNYYLDALYPIASEEEKEVTRNLVQRPGLEEKQAFFYQFWHKRDAMDPEGKWKEYKTWLDYVDANFSYPRTRGYRTDRGRVYLQYGPPDFIRDEKNYVSANKIGAGTNTMMQLSGDTPISQGHIHYLPYQLWRYNTLPGDDAKRCFLFWDEFRSGFYKLLHSNARGETRDIKWEYLLSQRQLGEEELGDVGEQFRRGY